MPQTNPREAGQGQFKSQHGKPVVGLMKQPDAGGDIKTGPGDFSTSAVSKHGAFRGALSTARNPEAPEHQLPVGNPRGIPATSFENHSSLRKVRVEREFQGERGGISRSNTEAWQKSIGGGRGLPDFQLQKQTLRQRLRGVCVTE